MADIEFAEGLIFKLPRNGAPEYVKGSLSIRREEFIKWLQAREGDWVNLELKESKNGKAYAAVDNWKPESKGGDRKPAPRGGGGGSDGLTLDDFDGSDIPFAHKFTVW